MISWVSNFIGGIYRNEDTDHLEDYDLLLFDEPEETKDVRWFNGEITRKEEVMSFLWRAAVFLSYAISVVSLAGLLPHFEST